MFPQHRRVVLAVALHRDELRQALPFALHQVLAARRAVEQLVPYARVKFLWMRL